MAHRIHGYSVGDICPNCYDGILVESRVLTGVKGYKSYIYCTRQQSPRGKTSQTAHCHFSTIDRVWDSDPTLWKPEGE